MRKVLHAIFQIMAQLSSEGSSTFSTASFSAYLSASGFMSPTCLSDWLVRSASIPDEWLSSVVESSGYAVHRWWTYWYYSLYLEVGRLTVDRGVSGFSDLVVWRPTGLVWYRPLNVGLCRRFQRLCSGLRANCPSTWLGCIKHENQQE